MGEFLDFIKYKLDFKQLILDVFTLGIYGALKYQDKIQKSRIK